MAPFNTHFLVAERLLPELSGPWTSELGQFYFGCIAPDVDKTSETLCQIDTHFFDRTTDYDLMATHRTATFLQQQSVFLSQPFTEFDPAAQAFALGYLCHLAVDEVSKHLWRGPTYRRLTVGIGRSFAALDEAARQKIQNYEAIVEAVCSIKPLDIFPKIPPADMRIMHVGACDFVRASDTQAEYLTLIDLFDRLPPAKRQERINSFQAEIETARREIHFFELDKLVNLSVIHSHRRLMDLINGSIPEPELPF